MSDAAAGPMPRRDLLLGGVLVGASALAFALQPRALPDDASMPLGDAVPQRVAGFQAIAAKGFVLPDAGPLSDRIYVDLLTRLYAADGSPSVMLLMAKGRVDDPGMSVHRPERCYRSAGFSIEDKGLARLPAPFPADARAVRMTARREDRVEQVLFWTRVGSRFPASALDQRLFTVRENLAGILPAGLLFRLSVLGDDSAAAFTLLERFNRAVVAASAPARMTLLGQ
ncbi:exosortase C-terminal domain/associated protein EpsI [Sphingomonas turrisvirgatae]|uniref:EpsI family protein n=1 Tax=Sphingomonas turrisvirgatae TaxID=1888892 RepID=A0A1E3LTH7_9SPHN|nr:exosortase C-terminal domain/associated protein EpsI [Sphingomonas turrisvirgatae]ODP36495.1 EpsI family protein [Sphingomonas turrisvirgatae]